LLFEIGTGLTTATDSGALGHRWENGFSGPVALALASTGGEAGSDEAGSDEAGASGGLRAGSESREAVGRATRLPLSAKYQQRRPVERSR
jgi:hypothetical protein